MKRTPTLWNSVWNNISKLSVIHQISNRIQTVTQINFALILKGIKINLSKEECVVYSQDTRIDCVRLEDWNEIDKRRIWYQLNFMLTKPRPPWSKVTIVSVVTPILLIISPNKLYQHELCCNSCIFKLLDYPQLLQFKNRYTVLVRLKIQDFNKIHSNGDGMKLFWNI